jgi:hypothetical protein
MEQGRSGFEPRACATIRSDADLSPAMVKVLFCLLLQKRTYASHFTLASKIYALGHTVLAVQYFKKQEAVFLKLSSETLRIPSARSIRPTSTSTTITTRTSISIEYPHHACPGTYGSDRSVLSTDPPEGRPHIGVDEGPSGEDDCRRERCRGGCGSGGQDYQRGTLGRFDPFGVRHADLTRN